MKLVIQLWTPTMPFFEAAPVKRTEAIAEIRRAAAEVPGVESLGWGAVDATAPRSTRHAWVSIWQVEDQESGDLLLATLEAAGWFHWFDATSVRTDISRSIEADDEMDDALIAIPHIEGTL